MTVNQAVTAFAGFMVLLSLALAWAVSPYFLAADRLCRREPVPVGLHRFLSGRDRSSASWACATTAAAWVQE